MKTVQIKTLSRRPHRPMPKPAAALPRHPTPKAELSRDEIRRIVLDILG